MATTTTTHWPLFQEQRTDALEKAAPALLDAIKAMVASYDPIRDVLTNEAAARLKAADEAIARAEGRA